MDQTPRSADDAAGRGPTMPDKQNPNLPTGFQPRPQGPPPQRFPINNGSAVGPRLGGGQPPPNLHRLDSRSALGAPAGPPSQFGQPRPPFGPPRPQPAPGAPPGQFPRGPPTPQGNQPPRFPPPGSSSGIRGPPYPPGQRPAFNGPQQQLRPQRQGSIEQGAGPRFPPPGSFPYSPDGRQPTPRTIPETVVTNPQGGNPLPIPRDPGFDRLSPNRPQPRERMDTNGPNLMNANQENIDPLAPKKSPVSRTGDIDDDDDDDVVMDNEKDGKSLHSTSNESLSVSPAARKTPTPEPRGSPINKTEISASPSPTSAKSPTPAPSEVEERSKSRLSDGAKFDSEQGNEASEGKSRPPSALSSRSGGKSAARTLDLPSPVGGRSSVVGFDNGRQRSLSPKSPSLASSPVASHSPQSPGTPKSERKAKFAPDEKDGSKMMERSRPGTPGMKSKPTTLLKSPTRPQTPKSAMRRSASGRSIKSDDGNDSGVNQTTQNSAQPTTNGVSTSPTKKLPSKSKDGDKPKTAGSPIKSPSKSVKSLPRTPEAGPPSTADKKKVPMNKVQVGAAPSPNLKTVRSKIGSLENASYKPGGGKVKIENRKLDFSKAQPKIAAKNEKYMPSGGDKKITQVKLQWNAKPKVGSLENATYRPGGGDKKIETVKLDFKDKAKPKVGSKDNAKHVPGGGAVKTTSPNKSPEESQCDIETQKLDIKAESKIGSLDNVKHKPGGGDKKIFNDRDYLRQTSHSNVESANCSGAQSPVPSNSFSDGKNGLPTSDENLNQES